MPRKLEMLLKGGHVIDPVNDINGVADVGVLDGRIARVEEDIAPADAQRVIDVGNLVVVPGLLDIHVHTYHTRGRQSGGLVGSLNADAHFLKEGVTTCVDTGTAGAEEFEHFRETVIDHSKIRMFAYVNIAAPGMGPPEQVVANLDPQRAAEMAAAHDEVCVGIKTAHYWTSKPFDDEHPPWASVDAAVEAGERCKMPVMVDFWPRPPERSYPDLILEHLRPGDIHTHVFARQFPVVDENGEVYDYMHEARERGIHFDLGHGAASFLVPRRHAGHCRRLPARLDQHRPAHGQHQRPRSLHARHDVQVLGHEYVLTGSDLPLHRHARQRHPPARVGDFDARL